MVSIRQLTWCVIILFVCVSLSHWSAVREERRLNDQIQSIRDTLSVPVAPESQTMSQGNDVIPYSCAVGGCGLIGCGQ